MRGPTTNTNRQCDLGTRCSGASLWPRPRGLLLVTALTAGRRMTGQLYLQKSPNLRAHLTWIGADANAAGRMEPFLGFATFQQLHE
jgi:hypothetical protein